MANSVNGCAAAAAAAASCGSCCGHQLTDYAALLQLFRCPVCCQYMQPPMPQCKKGHVLCHSCRPKVRGVCPICKQAVTNQTNLMMEKVGELIRFPCGYAEKGCGQLVPLREKSHHEAMCAHRPVHCHYYGQGCQTVLSVAEMVSHVRHCSHRSS